MIAPVILYAPKNYWEMSEKDKKRLLNGCGPDGELGDLVPEHIWGLRISAACLIHDYCYIYGEFTKDEADRIFLNNMLRLINANTKKWLINIRFPIFLVKILYFIGINRRCFKVRNPILWLRQRAAYVYYVSVHKLGGPYYWKGRNDTENLKGISSCN